MADVFTNLHTFFVVGPNHTGDDVFRFDDRPASRGEFYVRQVIGSVNYRTGGDLTDYAHLWLNYQIEHHLFPDVPMLAYRRVQPKVQALCARFGVPYLQEPVTRRFAKMARVFVGTSRMRRMAPRPRRMRPRAPSDIAGWALGRSPGRRRAVSRGRIRWLMFSLRKPVQSWSRSDPVLLGAFV
jgi:fatty acid desaturase